MSETATATPCYELVAAHELPTIDVTHTLLAALLRPSAARSFRAWVDCVHVPIMLLYACAFPLGAAVLVISPALARPLASLKIAMQIPVLLVGSSDLQLDILRCLSRTYEFWFFTLLNAATCAIFMLHLGDARMVMIPAYWYGIQMNVWSDAKIEARQLAAGAMLAALYHVFLLAIFSLHLVPEPRPFVLVSLGGRALSSHEFLMNAFATMLILMVRTAWRKRSLGKKDRDDPNVVSFVSYRCRLRARAPEPTGPSGPAPAEVSRRPTTEASTTRTKQKMRLIGQAVIVDQRAVLVPRLMDWTPSTSQRLALHLIGVLGFVGTTVTNVCIIAGLDSDFPAIGSALLPLATASLALTLAYCGLLSGMYHRQLLLRVLASFDVLFVLLQVTCAQLALCDLLEWSARCWPVLSAWVWRLLVTTQDGLTLETRRTLHFRRRLTALVVLVDVCVQALVTATLLRGGLDVLHDHVLLRVDMWTDRPYEFRTATFFLGRAFTTMLWSLRLLARVATSSEDVLIKVTGGVEFDGNPNATRRRSGHRLSLRFRSQANVVPVQVST